MTNIEFLMKSFLVYFLVYVSLEFSQPFLGLSPKRALKSLGMSDFPFRTYPDLVVETAYNNIVFFKNRVLINYFIMHIDNSQFSLNEAKRYLSILENCR